MTNRSSRTLLSAVKTGVAAALGCTGALALAGARARARFPLVVGYHRVVDQFTDHCQTSMPSLLTSRRTLEQHLDRIGRHYEFITLDEMETRIGRTGRSARPAAAVTFDDGYADVYHNAFPLLERKGIPFAVFCITDLIGADQVPLHDELYLYLRRALEAGIPLHRTLEECLGEQDSGSKIAGLRHADPVDAYQLTRMLLAVLNWGNLQHLLSVLRRSVPASAEDLAEFKVLDWNMLKAMSRAGVTIGSHTRRHALLTNEMQRDVLDELWGARQALRRGLGIEADQLAYPDGRFNRSIVEAARRCGYRLAYTTCQHVLMNNDRLTVPRRLLWENACVGPSGRFSPSILDCHTAGIFDYARRCPVDHA